MTSTLLPVYYGGPEELLDTIIFDFSQERSAAWLHDISTNTMVPCTNDQHWFAFQKIMDRLDAYPFT